MPEVCVVLPGIGGSVLTKNGRALWDLSDNTFLRILLGHGKQFSDLTLVAPEANGEVTASRLIDGAMIIPGFWNYGDYRPLTKRLVSLFGGAGNVLGFPYDWRLSNRQNAALLKTFIEDLLRSRHPDTKIVLIAHSMGGLVARRYLACEHGYERCSMLVTIGTPFQGAAKALAALANGIPKIPGRTGERLHSMLRSFPSVHELLPTYPCVSAGEGSRTLLSDSLPADIASTGLFEAAANFHATTAQAVAEVGPLMPPTLAVAGQQQPTATLAEIVQGQVRVRPDAFWATPQGHVRGAGDGSVPRISAQPPEWGTDTTRTHTVAGRHVNLPSDAAMYRFIAAALEGRQYFGLGPNEFGGLSVSIPEVVNENEALLVEAHHPDDRLELEIWATSLNHQAENYHSILRRLGNGQYERAIRGLGPGTYEVRVEGLADGGPQCVSELVTVLPPEVT